MVVRRKEEDWELQSNLILVFPGHLLIILIVVISN